MQSNRSKKTLVIEGIIRVISVMVLLLLFVVIGSKVVGEAVAGLLAVVLIIILLGGGALIGYGKVDWGVEVLISVALVELLGVVIYSNKIELKVIVLEVLLVLGAFVISRIFKREPKFIIFLIAAFFVWLFCWIKYINIMSNAMRFITYTSWERVVLIKNILMSILIE